MAFASECPSNAFKWSAANYAAFWDQRHIAERTIKWLVGYAEFHRGPIQADLPLKPAYRLLVKMLANFWLTTYHPDRAHASYAVVSHRPVTYSADITEKRPRKHLLPGPFVVCGLLVASRNSQLALLYYQLARHQAARGAYLHRVEARPQADRANTQLRSASRGGQRQHLAAQRVSD